MLVGHYASKDNSYAHPQAVECFRRAFSQAPFGNKDFALVGLGQVLHAGGFISDATLLVQMAIQVSIGVCVCVCVCVCVDLQAYSSIYPHRLPQVVFRTMLPWRRYWRPGAPGTRHPSSLKLRCDSIRSTSTPGSSS